MNTKAAWLLLFPVLLAGCASAPSPVPVRADPDDRASLEGEWHGEYHSPDTGRSGSIVFRLDAAADTAQGDVVMTPRGAGQPLGPATGERPEPNAEARPEVLTIRFVRIEENRVRGTLDPYEDPECGCVLNTTFEGELNGDVIEGTFTSRGNPQQGTQRGSWRVVRDPDSR